MRVIVRCPDDGEIDRLDLAAHYYDDIPPEQWVMAMAWLARTVATHFHESACHGECAPIIEMDANRP